MNTVNRTTKIQILEAVDNTTDEGGKGIKQHILIYGGW